MITASRIHQFLSLSFGRFFILIFLLSSVNIAHAQTELVPLGSNWRFLDNGSDQATGWRQPSFDDSSWAEGLAQLGYGDGDESTVVSFGGDTGNKYITTYFRHTFNVADPSAISNLFLEVIRDDGIVVYLNGTEVFRDNMPGGSIGYLTTASSALGGSEEDTLQTGSVDTSLLIAGDNVLAVEIHQANSSSSDISFDLRLSEVTDISLTRGPYLQNGTPDGVTVRWRTNIPTDSVVLYGTDPANLNNTASNGSDTTEHGIVLSGLNSNTRYYYSVGDSANTYASGSDYYFDTNPVPGSAQFTRVWAIGDSGTANSNAAAVRDAFISVNGGTHADVWLMLGDNAYNDGTDSEYQAAVFNMYPDILRNSVLWSTLGNHDGHTADSSSQSGPYYDIFNLPTTGEAGGIASGTEAYYSFDYANIHFVCLDSYETSRSDTGAMATWLENDLAATTQEWIIAYWHHPPYTKGSHDSDTEGRLIDMRTVFVPIFEYYGVDLVLSGHSHSYERSMLIDGHHGSSGTFGPSMIKDSGNGDPAEDGEYTKQPVSNDGAVFAVAGSSGKISSGSLNHPVMITNLIELGSMIIDVSGQQMDVRFINDSGTVRDTFRIIHESDSPPAAPSNLNANAQSSSAISLSWQENAIDETAIVVERSQNQIDWQTIVSLAADSVSYTDSGLEAEMTYYYRVYASNLAGNSAFSNVASATTDPAPSTDVHYAESNTTTFGTVSGGYQDTYEDNEGAVQSISEQTTGGNPRNRKSRLEHTWQIPVQTGASLTFYVNAWSSGSNDGDLFRFEFSFDNGSSWTTGPIVESTSQGNIQSFFMGSSINSTVLVKVTDTDRTGGNSDIDTIYVDHMYIESNSTTGTPPTAPTGLSAVNQSNEVLLSWNDVADELGYDIERSLSGSQNWEPLASTGSDTVNYMDNTVIPGTSYDYRVKAFNGFGYSSPSAPATVSTPAGIALSTNGFKSKGKVNVDLSWVGASSNNVEIYRNDSPITTTPNDGAHLDNTGQKNGTFNYKVCETNGTGICSNISVVNF